MNRASKFFKDVFYLKTAGFDHRQVISLIVGAVSGIFSIYLLITIFSKVMKEELRLARAERQQNRIDIIQMKVWVTMVASLVSAGVTTLYMAFVKLIIK